ncbi:GNAT family N-acetyltransferase [Photobacterium sp. BZF1]|uniref:GNAT family N-acetyltransferase n=1 Tax=Photobacterium sp. BZF1 TaxID=1904457 RepID=UPI00165385BE|nr:GNAT family N-acetyltransferase [Photobacterium sp. BZF1]MBC7005490.1 GNAT family N-acetyltransferase [Photobacterium sp. BZF1]
MYKIYNVNDYPKGILECAKYIHSKWGSQDNYRYFENAMLNSSKVEDAIPQFYVLVNNNQIVGCFGLIINDFVSRHDIYPWFSSLFIEPEHRGKRLCGTMFEHASNVAKSIGYTHLYLTTDHDGLYEKFGWTRIEDAYQPSGEVTKVYRKPVLHG